jgi:hypothetical protein
MGASVAGDQVLVERFRVGELRVGLDGLETLEADVVRASVG